MLKTKNALLLAVLMSLAAIDNKSSSDVIVAPGGVVSVLMPPTGGFDVLSKAGFTALVTGELPTAEQDFIQGLRDNPARVDLVTGLGETYLAEGDPKHAIAILRPIANDSSSQAFGMTGTVWERGMLDLTIAYCESGDWSDAVDSFNTTQISYEGSTNYGFIGEREESLPTLVNHYSAKDPQLTNLETDAYIGLAEIFDRGYNVVPEDCARAQKSINAALSLAPASDRVKFYHAYGMERSGDYVHAQVELTALQNSADPDVVKCVKAHLNSWKIQGITVDQPVAETMTSAP